METGAADEGAPVFGTLLEQFVAEGGKAFPERAAELRAAEARYRADPAAAVRAFAEDCRPLMTKMLRRDDGLLLDIRETRLFEGFCVPEDAVAENREAAMQYLLPLMSTALAYEAMPEETARLNDALSDEEVLRSIQALDGQGDMGEVLRSPEGQRVIGSVARAMGFEIDLDDPMLKGMMGMLQMAL